jgi:hypothetical protein
MKFKPFYITAAFACFFNITACNYQTEKDTSKKTSKEIPENNLSFKQVNGIRFYEVKRRFKNGLSFNTIGFQQVPTWVIEFKAPDTMLAYSPEKKGMEAFFLQLDHGKVYNFAREYFRALVINRDSLILQRLQVDGRVIAGDEDARSNVFCTYYSKDFIANKLKTTIGELQKPTSADTAFIKNLSQKTSLNPGNPSVAFAATQPVIFTPKSNFITVEKQSTQDYTTHRTAAYDYLYPEYKIVILRSYKAFAYRLHMVVDANGKMYVNSVDGVMPEFAESRKRMLQGITDVYLKNLLKISPGTTLNIPHSSQVTVNIVGKLLQ